jgi:putative transcriptional regulator
MKVFESMMQGLNEAVQHQNGTSQARIVKKTIKPVPDFNAIEIKQIRQQTGLSQVTFAGSLGISPKTVEAWERGLNKPIGSSRRLLEVIQEDPQFLVRFQGS